ncbi:BrnA antitoxin family protein [Nocardia asteroides]|uniref:BrnA antitoxin family protein n=1 Tax=Nocardia asteroides TaxID=1824 RepID=UPI001E59D498|nr:BrnA antitoxin family protein [Nocardia asteroides]UGT64742.1 BrnA antitoxin family protein [Nocardia asteroides]
MEEAADYYDTHDVAADISAATLTAHEPSESSPMAGYSLRLPKSTLRAARSLAQERGVSTGAWLRAVIEQAVAAHRRPRAAETIALQNLIDVYLSPAYPRGTDGSDEAPDQREQVRVDVAAVLEPVMALLEPIAVALREIESNRGGGAAANRPSGARVVRHPRTALGNAPNRRLASTRRKRG